MSCVTYIIGVGYRGIVTVRTPESSHAGRFARRKVGGYRPCAASANARSIASSLK